MRHSQRQFDEIRKVEIIPNFNPYAEGSCLIKCGGTHVVCTASVQDKVPVWLKGQNRGWITAEYGMLPRSTQVRVARETTKPSGRTQEIQRLVGRALRSVVDLEKLKDMSFVSTVMLFRRTAERERLLLPAVLWPCIWRLKNCAKTESWW